MMCRPTPEDWSYSVENETKAVAPIYDPPRIVDYGDLVELTAGGPHCVHPASIRKPGCQPPKFS
jgi:hypothetical protein